MPLRRTVALLALLAAAGAAGLWADGAASWTLGIAEMPSAVPEASRAALSQLPLLVLEKLRDLEVRFVPPEEARLRLERERLAALYAAGAEASALRDRRDAAALSPAGAQERAASERPLLETYTRKRRDQDRPADSGGASPDSLAVRLWSGHGSGRLVEDSADPGTACVREKLDYLVLWEVRDTAGYLRIRMNGWNPVLGRADASCTVYCPPDDVSSVAEELAQAVIRAASGRPSSRLVFDVDPPESAVYVDGRELAAGRRSLRVYEEREYSVAVEAWGGTRREFALRSEFGKDVRLEATIEAPASAPVKILDSVPEGASLYLDGIWAGTTPVEAPVFGAARVALLEMEGYEKEYAVLAPSGPDRLTVELRQAELGAVPEFERKKERFYGALGRVVVSLPVSLLAYGVYLQSASLHATYPGNASFTRRNDISLAAFAASGGVTAFFLASAAIRLAGYIQSAR